MSGTLQPFLAPLAPLNATPAATEAGSSLQSFLAPLAPLDEILAATYAYAGSLLQPFLAPLAPLDGSSSLTSQQLADDEDTFVDTIKDTGFDLTEKFAQSIGDKGTAKAIQTIATLSSASGVLDKLPNDFKTVIVDLKSPLTNSTSSGVLVTDFGKLTGDTLATLGGAEIAVGEGLLFTGLGSGLGVFLLADGAATAGLGSTISTVSSLARTLFPPATTDAGSSLQPFLAPLLPLDATPAASDTIPAATDDGSSLQPILAPLAPLIVSPPDTSVTIPDTTLGGSDTNPVVAPVATDDGNLLQPILTPLAPLDEVPSNDTSTPTVPVVSPPDTSVTMPAPNLGDTTPVGFDGDQVLLTTYYPNIAPANSIGGGSATVTPGTTTFSDFASLENGVNGTRLVGGSLTLSGDKMTFLFSPSEEGTSFYNAPFTGYDIQTAADDPAITAASIISTNIPGLTAADLSFSAHTIDLNVAGLTLPRDAPGSIVLGFSFQGQDPNVLTPVQA